MPPRAPGARRAAGALRDELGRLVLVALHAPPASWLVLPLAPLGGWLARRARARRPAVAVGLAAIYYAAVLAASVVLHGMLPFVRWPDGAFAALAIAGGVWVHRGGAARSRRIAMLAVALAFFQVVLPPTELDVLGLAALAAVTGAGTAALYAGLGLRAEASVSALAVGVALASAGVWGRQFVFYSVPARGSLARIESVAGLTRFDLPSARQPSEHATRVFTITSPRFLYESCDGGSYLLGRLNGLLVFPKGDPAHARTLTTGANNDAWLDCARDRLLLGKTDVAHGRDHELLEVDLRSETVTRRIPYCASRTLDTLHVDEPRGRIFSFDDTGAIQQASLARFVCERTIPGTFVRDFAIDPASGALVVWDAGELRRFDVERGEYTASLRLPSPWALPHGLAFHYGSVALDLVRREALVADLPNGILSAVGLDDWTMHRSRHLGVGIRYLAIDGPRGLAYVSNYSTGELLVVGLDDLAERRRIFVGRRVGDLSLSRDGDRLSFVTNAGGIAIDLPRFLAAAPEHG